MSSKKMLYACVPILIDCVCVRDVVYGYKLTVHGVEYWF